MSLTYWRDERSGSYRANIVFRGAEAAKKADAAKKKAEKDALLAEEDQVEAPVVVLPGIGAGLLRLRLGQDESALQQGVGMSRIPGREVRVDTVTDLGVIGNGDLEQAVCGQRRIRTVRGGGLCGDGGQGPGDGAPVPEAHAVRERWPETRIIVCSACDPLEAALLPETVHFIPKPCAERLVRKALQALRLH